MTLEINTTTEIMREETIKRVYDEQAANAVSKLIDRNIGYICVACNTAYENLPKADYEYGHGGRELNICRCGSDMIIPAIKLLDNCHRIISNPVVINNRKTHILKESNFKYCNCTLDGKKNEIHCGDTEQECGGKFGRLLEERSRDTQSVTFHCKKSDYDITVLKDSDDDVKMRDSEYFITPVSNW